MDDYNFKLNIGDRIKAISTVKNIITINKFYTVSKIINVNETICIICDHNAIRYIHKIYFDIKSLIRFKKIKNMLTNPQYLVRPNDFHIFEIDNTNDCYRSWTTKDITYTDGTRPNAQEHFTFKNLTENYSFFPIEENEISLYEKKNDEYNKFIDWQNRSDGHDGIKGGTYEEYLLQFNN